MLGTIWIKVDYLTVTAVKRKRLQRAWCCRDLEKSFANSVQSTALYCIVLYCIVLYLSISIALLTAWAFQKRSRIQQLTLCRSLHAQALRRVKA